MDSRKLYPKQTSRSITCPHCRQSNPRTAYACIHCFKILRQQPSFWSFAARPGYATVGLALLLIFAVGVGLKGWLAAVEARMTINVKTADYQVSLIADKKRREAILQKIEENETPAAASDPDSHLN